MEIKTTRNHGRIAEKIDQENAQAQVDKNTALIEYIAMMSDVELPEKGGNDDVSED